jgi:hypothetical protein
MNLQKNQKRTKEHNSIFQKLKFVMSSVSHIGSTMHCCQMSKVDAGNVDFLIRPLSEVQISKNSFSKMFDFFFSLHIYPFSVIFFNLNLKLWFSKDFLLYVNFTICHI